MLKIVFECFNSENVYFLEKGEIENYYTTYTENQYKIADNKKTDYYMKEYKSIIDMDQCQIEGNYKDITNILDKICLVTDVNTEKYVSAKIGDLIHNVQSVMLYDNSLTLEMLKNNPKIDWNSYQRIIDIIELSPTDGGFCCKFKILRGLTSNGDKVYDFNENTVAANFKV